MQTGKINVQTENIFPIIKKFLYSDHEIFLRELVSNAVDATTKLKTLSSLDKVKDELGDLTIEIILDKEKKTLTVKDKGIGMTSEEVKQQTVYNAKLLEQFASDGVITLSDEKIQITPDGQLFIRNVAASFDPLIQAGQTNFSKPV